METCTSTDMTCNLNVLQAPTQAELDPMMDALVVSEETLSGGTAINQGRAKRGLRPLQLVVVGLVGSGGTSKLSSTELRQKEAGMQPQPQQH